MKILKNSDKSCRARAEKYEADKKSAEFLNRALEKLLHEEIAKNRQKYQILIQQSRLAAMGEMIASIGQQWRQPLNSLSLLIKDVNEAHEFGEMNDKYMDRFTKESMLQITQMSRMINDFRKFYRSNKEKDTFSLAESIEDALAIFSTSLKNHEIRVKFEYRGQQMAFGYPNEFSQVILNLLMNSRDAFVNKEVKNRYVQIQIDEREEDVVVEFTDNAGGIEPTLLSRVFDPYFTTKSQGTGLGLYISNMILENMNGNVKVTNSGDGLQFLLSVPKVPVSEFVTV